MQKRASHWRLATLGCGLVVAAALLLAPLIGPVNGAVTVGVSGRCISDVAVRVVASAALSCGRCPEGRETILGAGLGLPSELGLPGRVS